VHVQDALTVLGFQVPITSEFTAATQRALAAFEDSRAISRIGVADARTWQLLVTWCNSSLSTQQFWLDAGWPQGILAVQTLACLHNAGFVYATFECWRGRPGQEALNGWWGECLDNVANARAAGFLHVGVYMWPQREKDPNMQASSLLSHLEANRTAYDVLMLDIEGDNWYNHSQAENRAFILALVGALEARGVRLAIYCNWVWPSYFGADFTALSRLPLIYAHYDNIPSFVDVHDTLFGGWAAASGKQFWDGGAGETICSSGALDWDWSAAPWWLP